MCILLNATNKHTRTRLYCANKSHEIKRHSSNDLITMTCVSSVAKVNAPACLSQLALNLSERNNRENLKRHLNVSYLVLRRKN